MTDDKKKKQDLTTQGDSHLPAPPKGGVTTLGDSHLPTPPKDA